MKLFGCSVAALAVLLASVAATAHIDQSAKDYLIVPKASVAPTIDGKLGDAEWRSGAQINGFVSISSKSALTQQTSARLLWDDKYLYVGIRCAESHLPGLLHYAKQRDGKVWQDDCAEVLIDTANAHRCCYHIMANCIGTVADEKNVDEHSDISWDSGCHAKAARAKGAWTLEMAIPFSSLHVVPAAGICWGLNICRERPSGSKEYSSWSPTPGGFVQPGRFGHIVLGDRSGKCGAIRLLSWGNLSSDTDSGGRNAVELEIANTSANSRRYAISLKSKGEAIKREVEVAADSTGSFSIPYTVADSSTAAFELSVALAGKQAFRTVHPSMNVPRTPRVWEVKDPLFTELLSNTPPGDQKDGTIYWFHNGVDSKLRPFAQEFGVRYSLDEQYKELRDQRYMMICQKSNFGSDFFTQMLDKYDVKLLYQPDFRFSKNEGVPMIDGLPYALDPRSRAAYFADVEWALKNHRDHIYGIYTQDEMHEKVIRQGVLLFAQMRDSYPFIKDVDRQVKQEFGFGKYGVPTSITDDNPYRWIAYHKWVCRQLLDWQRDVFELTRRLAPEVKVISIDPVAGHNPLTLDGFTPWVDIVTHQLYPSSNPNRQEFGFVTKFVADLVRKPVWPCAHVENYAYSTTPEETRELMSQVMRNGGKGFHLYLPDVRGVGANDGDTLVCKIGCPERYRAITEILDTTYKMNEVATPTDPDSAIFYSEDNYQSFPARDQVYPNEPEYAYTFLGPVSRAWFRFVNDNMVADGRDKLAGYKVVIVPAAKYERAGVVAKLADYVKRGGTLICGDPEAFTYGIDGASLKQVREKLFGAVCVPGVRRSTLKFSAASSLKSLRGRVMPLLGPTFDLKPAAGVEVMARYSDGRPAIIRHRVGRGSVILFAWNPFTEHAIGQNEWKSAFKAMFADLGLKTNRDIWRFKFPPLKTVHQPDVQGTCLTGNYVKWSQEKPLDVCNAKIDGVYRFSVAPDAVPDRGGAMELAFAQGKLTDRKRAPSVAKSDLDPKDFLVTWRNPEPFTLTFDLTDTKRVKSVHLWYSDQLPAVRVEGSIDGSAWVRLATSAKQQPTQDVLDLELTWNAMDLRFIRLSFDQRDPGQKMTLVETEVWSSN